MKHGFAYLMALALLASNAAGAQTITSCDWEVAHPSDPHHVGPGVSSSDVDTGKAIAACRAALEADPGNPRFQYQLARALVYHAGRTDGSDDEGMRYLGQAAAAGYTQAMFVYGLMLQRHGKTCEVEPWTRRAADQGLKAARIAYVNDALTGTWSNCDITAGPEQMHAYLDGAAEQVSGYYENMLLSLLRHLLNTAKEA